MLDEVEIIPVLHKVTGAGHSCKGGGPGGVDIGGGGDLGVWTLGGGGDLGVWTLGGGELGGGS